MKFKLALVLLLSACKIIATDAPFNIVIIGLGSRSQDVLLECFRFNKNIRVVAACDDHAQESHQFYLENLIREKHEDLEVFKQCFANTKIYADSEVELKKLFKKHTDIDAVFITSANQHHARHLNTVQRYCACDNVYMEKPLFKTLDEYMDFSYTSNSDVLIGLTLRYSSMAKIVSTQLKLFKDKLGALHNVHAWEYVKFCQGVANFMMSWRRHISLSGGFLLEKCVHDLDLAFFFMNALGIEPQRVTLATKASHELYYKDNKERIVHEIMHNPVLNKSFTGREHAAFERSIPFSFDAHGSVNWVAVLDDIFADFPQGNNFKQADIIPDTQQIKATIMPQDGKPIDFQLDVTMAQFIPNTIRGMKLSFEHGLVEIDVMQSIMKIILASGDAYTFDLHTLNSDHADGDAYIARAILGMEDEDQIIATFHDPIVQFANLFALVSEKQALLHDTSAWSMQKHADKWIVAAH